MSRLRSSISRSLRIAANSIRARDLPRIYGVGAAKTGTHSLTDMFSDRIAAAHEADHPKLIRLILEREKTGASEPLQRELAGRDRLRRLKLDASHVNIYLLGEFETLFPGSRYVLTYRSPIPWLRSMLDQNLRTEEARIWARFRDWRFARPEILAGAPAGRPAAEASLEARGLYRLDGYLHYWRDSIERVLRTVPEERRLLVRTEDLAARSAEIAAFCGIPGGGVEPGRAHSFVSPKRYGALAEIPDDHILEVAERQCGALFRELFADGDLAEELRRLRTEEALPDEARDLPTDAARLA